jgi:hypothetical protein
MSTATSATAMQRASAAPQRTNAAPRAHAEPVRQLKMGSEEAAILNIDLAGLPLPKVGGLNVDGFKPSLFDRLFGKR